MNKIIELFQCHVQHYNPKKHWKCRKIVIESQKPIIYKYYCLYKIKKMDAFNNASMGTGINEGAKFKSIPEFPHGLNGIIVSHHAIIGKNCKIYHQVTIGQDIEGIAPIIGDNVTIFPGAKIIGNVKIGNNAIVGAGSVVTKSFGDNCIVAGVPARIIKIR